MLKRSPVLNVEGRICALKKLLDDMILVDSPDGGSRSGERICDVAMNSINPNDNNQTSQHGLKTGENVPSRDIRQNHFTRVSRDDEAFEDDSSLSSLESSLSNSSSLSESSGA